MAAEINNTFYRLPKTSVLESWAEQVPDGFRFSIKASRKITHFTRLKAGSQEPTEYLLSTLGSLGDRMGVLLFQLPPNFKKDIERFTGLLAMLPEGTPVAWEFRHESWFDDDTDTELLKLSGFLRKLQNTSDVRPIVRDHFKTHRLIEKAGQLNNRRKSGASSA